MPENAALLVMDVQRVIVERFGDDSGYLARVDEAISAARSAQIPVIYVVVGFRPGFPEISSRNFAFSATKRNATLGESGDGRMDVHPAIAPQAGDIVVTKRRVSAFAGSDLDVVLRGLEVTHLVLSGIATSGVVLSTVRQAADLDFRLTVLQDACLDGDPEVHRVLTEKVFPRQAAVVSVQEWAKALAG
ncbi:isochorismatase family cysteine hydrolase [Actinocrinis sp.]|uniref:cysteine hydrolase family protein n=1 Tax=Actinocrinis sp. TaxID=1920516 RepID=UPI002D575648|nr:isochorismatase family cysteine hydrolase [Actinocrinis sp.]HZP53340.1 isochorismatase family cysteine hydrolase [Actinocrinis sp.]